MPGKRDVLFYDCRKAVLEATIWEPHMSKVCAGGRLGIPVFKAASAQELDIVEYTRSMDHACKKVGKLI